jgi:hypothetical protein
MYKLRAPTDIEIVEIIVPIHFPNNIPDNKSIGDPKPNRTTQIIENIKKSIRLKIKFFPIVSSIFSWIVL